MVGNHKTFDLLGQANIIITADRDARRSDGSDECKGVRQQNIIKYQ